MDEERETEKSINNLAIGKPNYENPRLWTDGAESISGSDMIAWNKMDERSQCKLETIFVHGAEFSTARAYKVQYSPDDVDRSLCDTYNIVQWHLCQCCYTVFNHLSIEVIRLPIHLLPNQRPPILTKSHTIHHRRPPHVQILTDKARRLDPDPFTSLVSHFFV